MASGGRISARTTTAGELKRALNESGWLDGEVVAAGHFRQGKAPSMAAMFTGTALIEVLRPRRSKLLPRQFVLAATTDRLAAFKALGVGHGEETDIDYSYEVKIKPGKQASIPRANVSITDLSETLKIESGTLIVDGERIPVTFSDDPDTQDLVKLLAG
jgi:hypothetical protein